MASALFSWDIFFAAVSALILFLYGIENFSQRIQLIAGQRFRQLLARLTKNPWKGALLGAVSTAIVQSSTAITVISVSLVNSGTISFAQSLGIIIGANIGTTFTAQLLANNLATFGPLFIALGFLFDIFGKKYKFLGKPIFYFGLVFFSMTLLTGTLVPFKNDPAAVAFVSGSLSLPVALLAGIILTIIFQSSAVTTGLIIVLAQANLITLANAIPLLLGANIGTTTTALFAASRMDLFAKRAAAAHTLFNVIGAVIFIPLLVPFAYAVSLLGGSVAQQIANAHVIFNVANAVIFLALIAPFTAVVERLVQGNEREILFRTRFLEERLPEANSEAFARIENELRHAMEITAELLDESMKTIRTASRENTDRVAKLEALNDFLDEKIESAIHALSTRKLSETDALKTILLVRMSNVVERIGDNGEDISNVSVAIAESGSLLPDEQLMGLEETYALLRRDIGALASSVPMIEEETVKSVKAADKEFWDKISKQYELHLKRLSDENVPADSRFLEALSVMEAVSAKAREIRKLAAMYPVPARGAVPQKPGSNV